MAIVEFSITVQTGSGVNDPITDDDRIVLNEILADMRTVASKSDYGFEIADWQEVTE